MCKDQIVTEKHHRKPRSLGGTESPANVSYVISRYHKNWHTLFGNMNAYQVCCQINKSKFKAKELRVVCKFINGIEVLKSGENFSKKQTKTSYAWYSLFKDLEFEEIIKYINNVWLDPSYHFYIEKIL